MGEQGSDTEAGDGTERGGGRRHREGDGFRRGRGERVVRQQKQAKCRPSALPGHTGPESGPCPVSLRPRLGMRMDRPALAGLLSG